MKRVILGCARIGTGERKPREFHDANGERDIANLKRWIGGFRCGIEIALRDVSWVVVALKLRAVVTLQFFGELVEKTR